MEDLGRGDSKCKGPEAGAGLAAFEGGQHAGLEEGESGRALEGWGWDCVVFVGHCVNIGLY